MSIFIIWFNSLRHFYIECLLFAVRLEGHSSAICYRRFSGAGRQSSAVHHWNSQIHRRCWRWTGDRRRRSCNRLFYPHFRKRRSCWQSSPRPWICGKCEATSWRKTWTKLFVGTSLDDPTRLNGLAWNAMFWKLTANIERVNIVYNLPTDPRN